MTQRSLLVTLLNLMIMGAGLLHAQEVGPRSISLISALESLAHTDAARAGAFETQSSQTQESGGPPVLLQIVAQFLQLQPNQIQEFQQLVQSRQAVITVLIEQIQQQTRLLDKLLGSGGNPQQIGALVIQIHALQQKVAQTQQDFLSRFVSLLDNDQRQRLETVRIAYRLQPILPAFEQLSLL